MEQLITITLFGKPYNFRVESDILKAQEVADHLGTEITIVEGAGHFNESAGYKEFPLLLKKIKEELKS